VSEPFVSEIRIMSFSFPPKGWAFCNGQLLPINQYQALFALLGTRYGGDGRATFGLPNLQGRTAIHNGTYQNGAPFTLAQIGGEQAHALTAAEMPVHNHMAYGTPSNADSFEPTGNYLGAAQNMYGPPASLTTISPATVGNAGGSQQHNNLQPYLVLNFCIALQGIFPTQN
jgi:microcystin-dependent protein